MKNKSRSSAMLIKALNFLALFVTLSIGKLNAQCMVNTLNVSTGTYNSSTITPGNNDPLWYCINKTGNFIGSLPPVGSNARVVTPNGSWAGGGTWICDTQVHVSPGITTTMTSNLTFERRFNLCVKDDVTFDLDIRSDGRIAEIYVDGVPQGLTQTVANWGGGPLWMPAPFTITMAPGLHTLWIEVSDPTGTGSPDPIGFLLNGTITTVGSNLVNDQDPDCADYKCKPRCEDECYWTVDGNNIQSGRNIFGTLTNDDIRIVSNMNTTPDRGVIKGGNATTGGYLGWNNTNPTARFHVDCINGNNPASIIGLPSDIRFENLEPGHGYILVIDDQGYVYNSRIPAPGGPMGKVKDDDLSNLQQQIRELKTQLAELRSTIANPTADKSVVAPRNVLYQNTPNPLTNETTIKYNIVNMGKDASIVIYDRNGRGVEKHAVQPGEGSVNISSSSLSSGVYMYSLIVDGEVVDTKKMLITK